MIFPLYRLGENELNDLLAGIQRCRSPSSKEVLVKRAIYTKAITLLYLRFARPSV